MAPQPHWANAGDSEAVALDPALSGMVKRDLSRPLVLQVVGMSLPLEERLERLERHGQVLEGCPDNVEGVAL